MITFVLFVNKLMKHVHLFFQCDITKTFWSDLSIYIFHSHVNFTLKDKICYYDNKTNKSLFYVFFYFIGKNLYSQAKISQFSTLMFPFFWLKSTPL